MCGTSEEEIWINPCVTPRKDSIHFTPIARERSYIAMLGKAHK